MVSTNTAASRGWSCRPTSDQHRRRLPDAGDADAPGAVQREDGSWLLDGSLAIDAAARVLGVEGMSPDGYVTSPA